MKELIGTIKEFMRGVLKQGEKEITAFLYSLKRKAFRFTVELSLFALGAVFVLVAAVLFLSKVFPIEWVLLIAGLILLNVVLLIAKFR